MWTDVPPSRLEPTAMRSQGQQVELLAKKKIRDNEKAIGMHPIVYNPSNQIDMHQNGV